MVLKNLYLHSRVNQVWDYSGIDDPRNRHQQPYPYTVKYIYNSRGFRDREWPDNLEDCIWCFGDSFTVGIGSKLEHTWVYQLEKVTGKRCINISLDGASNDWILNKVQDVINEVNPKHIVVQWSYFHRGHATKMASDENNRLHVAYIETETQIDHFKSVIGQLAGMNVVHTFIPEYCEHNYHGLVRSWNDVAGPDWPELKHVLVRGLTDTLVKEELKEFFVNVWENLNLHIELQKYNPIYTPMLDQARDGYHYDIKTATHIVNDIVKQL